MTFQKGKAEIPPVARQARAVNVWGYSNRPFTL